MSAYLSRIEKPKGFFLKMAYFFSRRQAGKVISPIAIFAARMPNGFASFYGKIATLDKKLRLPKQTVVLVREQVASINTCMFCRSIGPARCSPTPRRRRWITRPSSRATRRSNRTRSRGSPATTTNGRSATSSGLSPAST